MTGDRSKAERSADEASAEVRRLLARQPPCPSAIRAAIRKRDRAWRLVSRLREQEKGMADRPRMICPACRPHTRREARA